MAVQRYAVLIGNAVFPEDTAHLNTLRCPVNDVKGLGDLLTAEQHGLYGVTSIVDGSHDAARRAIYQCLRKAKPDDIVLIYYSGHGKLDEDGNLYLVTRDTSTDLLPPTSIPVDDIRRYMRESSASAVVVILDCCFSGAVKKMFKGNVADQASQAISGLEGKGNFFLTASTDTQLAEEKETDEYSLLTKHIIEGIRSGLADVDDDGRVSFQELCSFVQKKVATEGRQRPKAWFLDTAGDVTVALTGKPASDGRRKAVAKKLYEMAAKDFIGGQILAELLRIINQSAGNTDSGADPKSFIDGLYAKLASDGEFVQESFRIASELRPASTPTGIPEKANLSDRTDFLAGVAKETGQGPRIHDTSTKTPVAARPPLVRPVFKFLVACLVSYASGMFVLMAAQETTILNGILITVSAAMCSAVLAGMLAHSTWTRLKIIGFAALSGFVLALNFTILAAHVDQSLWDNSYYRAESFVRVCFFVGPTVFCLLWFLQRKKKTTKVAKLALFELYSKFSEDEILNLAQDLSALTDEARSALDVELKRRTISLDDIAEYGRHIATVKESP
jgi:hypothetical protein